MSAKPSEWNIVVVGAWNLAILTPSGVARRLLQLEAGTPVEVHVALAGVGPIRVVYEQMMVMPSSDRLTVQPGSTDRNGMLRAAAIASRAITGLPETPVSAVGVNFRFGCDELPDTLIKANRSALDDSFAQVDIHIVRRHLRRALSYKSGVLNLEVQENEDGSGTVTLNFHKESSQPSDLCAWLDDTGAMYERAVTLLTTVLGVTFEESK
jgi:hypothetical protein